jgi:RND family efflux transporter MFP subunit
MKRNRIIIGVVAIVVVVGIAFILFQRSTPSSTSSVRVQTTAVQRGTLVATVSAAGNVSAPKSASIAFQVSGRVAQVPIQIGDSVKKGQVLLQLDTTDLDLALKTAKTNLASATTNLEQTKANLQFALRTAQANLDNSKTALDAAKAQNAQSSNPIVSAKAQLDKATIALQTAQGAYDRIAWRGDVSLTQQATDLQNATVDYRSAVANYNMTIATINDSALKVAQNNYDKSTVALEQAQKNMDTQLRTAQATVDSAQVAVDQAQRNLDNARIVAPFDGSISALNFSAGDLTNSPSASLGTAAKSGTAVSILDLSSLQIKVTIAEVDIAKIQVGQSAQITMDALPGNTYAAKIIQIGPVGAVTQGVVNYPVTAVITNNDGQVKPGMTANLAITVERRDNVLLVPNRTIRTQGTQKTVTVLYKGQSITVPVTVGLTNDQSAEVTSGLQEGDQVVIQTTQTRTGGGGLGPGPGGFGP